MSTRSPPDGGKGVEEFRDLVKPDLVLLDIMLPVHGRLGSLHEDPGDQQDPHHHAHRQG